MHSAAADPGLFKGYEAPTPEGALSLFEFFAVNTKLPEMVILVSKNFTIAKKLPSVGLDLMITGSRDF